MSSTVDDLADLFALVPKEELELDHEVMFPHRRFWLLDKFSDGYGNMEEKIQSVTKMHANLISSLVVKNPGRSDLMTRLNKFRMRFYPHSTWQKDQSQGELHAPAIDIDLPCRLIPSSTEGHYHLFIDKVMPWDDYLKLLTVMAEVGIVEKGYVEAAESRQMTMLRLAHDKKGPTKP